MAPGSWFPIVGGSPPLYDQRWPVATRLKAGGFIGDPGIVTESDLLNFGGLNQIVAEANRQGAILGQSNLPVITRATKIDKSYLAALVAKINTINVAYGFTGRIISGLPNYISRTLIGQMRDALNNSIWFPDVTSVVFSRVYTEPAPWNLNNYVESNGVIVAATIAFDSVAAGAYVTRLYLRFSIPSSQEVFLGYSWVQCFQNTNTGSVQNPVLPVNAYLVAGSPTLTFDAQVTFNFLGSFVPQAGAVGNFSLGVLSAGSYTLGLMLANDTFYISQTTGLDSTGYVSNGDVDFNGYGLDGTVYSSGGIYYYA